MEAGVKSVGAWWAAVAAAAVLAGCGNNSDLPYPDQIEKVPGTDNQTVAAETRLPAPLAVIVRTQDATPLPRVKVRWSVPPGSGSLSDSVTLSDGNGRAQAYYTVGRATGAYNVQAELVVTPARNTTFLATATAAPTLASVAPSQFSGGDVVTVQG